MTDDHLIAPPDAALPSRRVGAGVLVGVVLVWGIALGAADHLRSVEVEASARARAVDPTTLASAPPATFPGGVDERSLDPSGSPQSLAVGHGEGPRGPVHEPHGTPQPPHRAGPPAASGRRPAHRPDPNAPPEPR